MQICTADRMVINVFRETSWSMGWNANKFSWLITPIIGVCIISVDSKWSRTRFQRTKSCGDRFIGQFWSCARVTSGNFLLDFSNEASLLGRLSVINSSLRVSIYFKLRYSWSTFWPAHLTVAPDNPRLQLCDSLTIAIREYVGSPNDLYICAIISIPEFRKSSSLKIKEHPNILIDKS